MHIQTIMNIREVPMKKIYYLIISFVLFGLLIFKLNYYTIHAASDTDLEKDIQGEYMVATFAGGCFWCVEADFEKLNGTSCPFLLMRFISKLFIFLF